MAHTTGVALAGLMGAGKSTVGGLLASALKLPFVDLDDVVVQFAKMPISEVFSTMGEASFRAIEADALRHVLAGPACVLALGGGTVHQPGAAESVRTRMPIIVLDAPLAVLQRRVGHDPTRPLATTLSRLYRERAPALRTLGPVVRTAGRSPADVVTEVCALLASEIR